MSLKNKFKKDLQEGNNGEKIIMLYLFCQGMKFISYNNDYKYDIKMFSEKRNEEVFLK